MRRMPWVALGALLAGLGAWVSVLLQPVVAWLPGCAFKRLTGFACASCGLTRSVMALGQWHWREAFHWHPAAVVLAALLPVLALWDLRRAWRDEPYPPLPSSRLARISAWVLLVAIWILQAARGI